MDKDKPARADGVVRHNCWTCHNCVGTGSGCAALDGLRHVVPPALVRDWLHTVEWSGEADAAGFAMPVPESDGCPGWVRR